MVGDTARQRILKRAPSLGRGVVYMLVATAVFTVMGVCVKWMREVGFTTTEVLFWRNAPGLLVLLPLLWSMRVDLRPSDPRAVALRSLFGLLAMSCNFYAMFALTLVQFTTLYLLQPVLVAVLAPFLLAEPTRRATYLALGLGILGSLAILRPDASAGAHGVPLDAALAAFGAALFSALAGMSIRHATRRDPPDLIVFHFAASVSLVALAWGAPRGEILALPDGVTTLPALIGIAGVALTGLAGQMLLSRAYGNAPAAIVAVIGYAAIPFGLLADQAVWGAMPSAIELVGCVLVTAAGLMLWGSAPRASTDAGEKPLPK
jgi:S-adenosylmethionine uptake transporter